MSFVIICGILWYPVCTHFPVIHLVPDNSVHYPVKVQLSGNVSMPCIICSEHAWCPGHYFSTSVLPLLKATHYICLFSWYYTYSIHFTNCQWIFTGATHYTKIKTHFILQSLPWFQETIHLQSAILMVSTHCCTMTQFTCADYMLKSAVP